MRRFEGTLTLLRFALRRDRILLPAWTALYLLYSVGGGAAAIALFPDLQSRLDAAAAINGMPAMMVMYGRVWDPQSLGSVALIKPIGFGAVFAGLLGILFVTRHTRTEEESGRFELLGSLVVGRWAPLSSALLLALGTLTVIAIVNGAGVAAAGLPAGSTWAWALSTSLGGMVFAALAAVTGQLTQSARTANVIALVTLAAAVLLRGTADASGDATQSAWWAWLSPIGWQDQVRAFAGDRWSLLALFPIAIGVLLVIAYAFAGARDLDAGLIPQRKGRPTGASWLRTPIALAWRLQRGLFLGLVLSFAGLSALLGAISSNMSAFLENESMRTWLMTIAGTDDASVAFIMFEMGFAAFLTALCGVIFARRLGVEEQAGRIEPVLATRGSHAAVYLSYTAIVLAATLFLQLTLAVGFWLSNGVVTGDYSDFSQVLTITMVYLPAIWVMSAIALAVAGIAPHMGYLGWAALGGAVFVSEFGAMFQWPSFVMNLSPFMHVPRVPAMPMNWTPMGWLTLIAVALAIIGFARFRLRDLATP